VKGLINFLEQQSDDCTKEISNLNALKCKLTRKMECEIKQTSIWIIFQTIIINKNFLRYQCFIK
jgi:hypothetical protein